MQSWPRKPSFGLWALDSGPYWWHQNRCHENPKVIPQCHSPPRKKALLRPKQSLMVVNDPLRTPRIFCTKAVAFGAGAFGPFPLMSHPRQWPIIWLAHRPRWVNMWETWSMGQVFVFILPGECVFLFDRGIGTWSTTRNKEMRWHIVCVSNTMYCLETCLPL